MSLHSQSQAEVLKQLAVDSALGLTAEEVSVRREQYGQNKKEITARIEDLIARRDRDHVAEIDVNAFSKKVAGIVDFIQRDDVTEESKNEALHTIIEKIVYEKAKGNVAIYFHDI